ncbi:MAG: ATP-grasp domain-containing protein [Bacteroidaceae bacterium]|nr:ATP-grasp domain-containing protein [Bacteroidaceae bacterium]
MNFIFISPNFPHTYENFCYNLKQNGVNVLGIADTPYDALSDRLKDALTEYYRVDNMEDYDQMYRAVAFFAHKYGRIDWIESNNEYWLEQDARLRTDFNICSGIKEDHIMSIKEKSQMKKYYAKGKVPTARQIKACEGLEKALEFASLAGYPLFTKPDNGCGANGTRKIHNEEELRDFFAVTPQVEIYVIEEFISGNIYSYDAVINSKGEPIFESCCAWPPSISDIVNEEGDLAYFVDAIPDQLRKYGRKTVKAFGIFSRFVHLEFFCMDSDHIGLGKKGDFCALEVNMRPAGGFTPDMMNYSWSTDVFKIWADMVAFDENHTELGQVYHCAYASQRNNKDYAHSRDEINQVYAGKIMNQEPVPAVLSGAMGDYMFLGRMDTVEEAKEFIKFVTERK